MASDLAALNHRRPRNLDAQKRLQKKAHILDGSIRQTRSPMAFNKIEWCYLYLLLFKALCSVDPPDTRILGMALGGALQPDAMSREPS